MEATLDELDTGHGPLLKTTAPVFNPALCARHSNPASKCGLCASACPASCIATDDGPASKQPIVTDFSRCLSCALCAAACPTGAFTSFNADLLQITRRMERLAKNYSAIYLSCRKCDATSLSGAIVEVPCLGCLPSEFYVYFLNGYRHAAVYLPAEACQNCALKEPGERMMMEAVAKAEQICGYGLGLACSPEDLDFFHVGIDSDQDLGRRGFLTSFADLLSDSARRHASEKPTLGLGSRAELAKRAREAHERAVREREERFAEAHQTGVLRRTPKTLTQTRELLAQAVRENPSLAAHITLESVRSGDTCSFCRRCLSACPLSARRIRSLRLETDDLYCVACGKCIDLCPTDAIYSVEVPGEQIDWEG